jgi:transposase
MQVVHPRCCGLDIHKKTVVACVLLTQPEGLVERHIRTFTTMTRDLQALDEWLRQYAVEHIALESTGVYTLPIMLLKKSRSGNM